MWNHTGKIVSWFNTIFTVVWIRWYAHTKITVFLIRI